MISNRQSASPNTVGCVVLNHLCTSCGGCAGSCPFFAIQMIEDSYGTVVPQIDEQLCTGCGICLRVCPGISFDYPAFQKKIHGKLPEHVALGNYLDCFAGYSLDKDILPFSQSGGFVSALLVGLLEHGEIDGAVVSRRSSHNPFRPETIIAKTKAEILSAVGSIYNPVPAAAAIKNILATPGRYAVVGTSCQIQAYRKAEEVFPDIANRVVLYVGLHCLGVFTNHFYEYIISKKKINKIDITEFRHRSKLRRGWPGEMLIRLKDDRYINVNSKASRFLPRPFFTNWRCQLCFDKANEFSDVSCGDCRMKELLPQMATETSKFGISEVVVRTQRGADFIDSFKKSADFMFYEANSNSLVRSNKMAVKKLGLPVFMRIAVSKGWGVPNYGVSFDINHKINFFDYLGSFNYWFSYEMGTKIGYRKFLSVIPGALMGFQTVINMILPFWGRSAKKDRIKSIVPCDTKVKNENL